MCPNELITVLVAERLRLQAIGNASMHGKSTIAGRPAGSRIVVVAPIARWCASSTSSGRPL